MSQTNMIKPESIDRLPFLPEDKKQYYKTGLANLWRLYESQPEGSPGRTEAEQKIRHASQKVMTDYSNAQRNGQGAAAARPGSGGGGAPPPPMQQQQQQVQGQGPGPGQARPLTQGSMNTAPRQPQQQQLGNGQPMQQQQPQQGQQQPSQLSQQAQQDLRSVTIHAPYGTPPQQALKYKQSWFQRATVILRNRDAWIGKGKQAQQHLNTLNGQSQEIPPNIRQALESAKRGVQEVNAQWANLKAINDQQGRQNATTAQQQQQVNGYQGASSGQVDVKVESRTSVSPQQPQGTFQQQPQQVAPVQGTPSANLQLQTPQTAPQAQPTPQNFPQQQQYANQQRPPMPQQMSQQNMQHAQPPPQAMPNNAPPQPQQQQRPQALTQEAAHNKATAEHYNRQPANNNAQLPNGLPYNVPASTTTQQQQPHNQLNTSGDSSSSAAYPNHLHQQLPGATTPTQNHKFHIPKTLTVNPLIGQTPVQAPTSRPTLGNSGMLQQPGLARPPTFTLEGEGDHVLSKRKLDELVRQVTGSAGPSASSSSSASATDNPSSSASTSTTSSFLAPEVEESVLQLADDFVDDLITASCRLAKLRPGGQQVLEMRDVQMVLERNYGMRIPGFTLEEVRTVRKFAPAQGWQNKMGAVQSAKTLGGVGAGLGKGE
ncbi:Transcription initiation factor TFIID subunit 12 [Friedmanniomyces endolithicus]|uniref:Transcription initiation factor TFIID subunit 12 n=1 Tax=Friedmanniomyces endolithicus TaxID=329885 RepID=A0A4V5N8B0_9PEZI|nr:Transcription initiation factor TFIID subunit 12 [Friedmanniomyces endolithicus]KAK0281788.1 Transcription initiation factor TFIID subunit 12 [Friedmanniomyces endolithicus]KAK0297218.1 Transcription initiation factor TFIID subunit 12 [Friedmanniomyces endolithicus]KAK0309533.1 Transcription initiation factor TFIID subunit 12 [Friedmanniomyces endolithicus]KAK0315641.1 Transcription initiation factor TFIID subunit 12 [Friedmanniomyces endolithicus]